MITERDAQYAYDIVKRVCDEVGPGLPGSAQERARATLLKTELETHLGADHVAMEEFELAPRAFLASVPIGAVLTAASMILVLSTGGRAGGAAWVGAASAVACALTAVIVVALEFFGSFELIDRLFPKARSVTVVGTLRHPRTREVKRLLLLSGHHDSAPENTWLRLLGYGGLFASAIMPVGYLTALGLSVVTLVVTIRGGPLAIERVGAAALVLLAFPIAPSILAGLFFTRGSTGSGVVPGAVDNLAACALLVSLARFLVKHEDSIPPDVEIRFLTFGSEEAGLRGSRRYAQRHRSDLERLDARLVNVEMVAHPVITILSSDLHGTVRSAPDLVQELVAAAKSAGVPYRVKSAGPGTATDAAPFSQRGLKAATLFPFQAPQQLVAFYHQSGDRPEVVTLPPLENVMKLALAWIRNHRRSKP